MKKNLFIIGIALVVVFFLFVLLANFNEHKTFVYPGGELDVLVADNFLEQEKGLSGTRAETLQADGMLFEFKDQEERVFWMNGMNYALDIVWIRDNKIVKIQTDVPAPKPGEDPVKMYSRPFEVDMVLEVPAGIVGQSGMVEGHLIEVK